MARRPPKPKGATVKAADLAKLLGQPERTMRSWLAGHGVTPRKRYGVEVYDWSEAAELLTPEQRAEARRVARAEVAKHSSKQWLSGYPALVAQWHPTKNSGIEPWEVSYGSTKTIWWKCDKGPDHEWPRPPNGRTRGAGCPCCSGYRLSVTNRLSVNRPDIAKQWHESKNKGLAPADVTLGSCRKVWWRCPKGPDHEWQTTVVSRTSRGTGCPACEGLKVSVTNSLASRRPDLAKQWHPKRNGRLKPKDVVAASGKRVWWRCPKGSDHVWDSPVVERASQNVGCPYCAGKRISRTNNLRHLRPDLARQWHPKKNDSLSPSDVTLGTARRVWWKCQEGSDHEWQAGIATRAKEGGTGCPFCSGTRPSQGYSLAKEFPKLAGEWHPTKNAPLRPRDVTPSSMKKVWWRCKRDSSHSWQSTVASRTHQATKCPYCSGVFVTDANRLSTLFPDVAKEWHPTKNGELTPDTVHRGSDRRVWWKCRTTPEHEWQSPVKVRTTYLSRCPYCVNRKVHPTNCLAVTHPKIAAEWHPSKNDELTARDVVAGYQTTRVWWKCSKVPTHVWQARPKDRTARDTGCPICRVSNRATAT